MAGETESILQHLRAIDANDVAKDVREIKTRVGILEQQYASVSTRIDNIDARLDPAPVTSFLVAGRIRLRRGLRLEHRERFVELRATGGSSSHRIAGKHLAVIRALSSSF